MSAIEIRKAQRFQAKLRLALAGPSGAGKTMSGLKLAHGLGGRVCMIDTERGSGDLYANLFDYDIITLTPPFKPERYVEAIHAAEKAGYDTIFIDSLSHAWSDEGGLLDQADRMQAAGKNRFTMWAELTPQHRQMVNAMLNSPCHIVVTVRSKQGYAMETDEKTGRTNVRKVGLEPVQRDGLEYEFTVFMDIDQNHQAHASKDRTNLFKNEIFEIDEKMGGRLLAWLNEGEDRNTVEGKKKIVQRLKYLNVSLDQATVWVQEICKLPLEPKHYDEIISRLDVIVQETREAAAKPATPQEAVNAPVAPVTPSVDERAVKAPEKAATEQTIDKSAPSYEYPDDDIRAEDIPF